MDLLCWEDARGALAIGTPPFSTMFGLQLLYLDNKPLLTGMTGQDHQPKVGERELVVAGCDPKVGVGSQLCSTETGVADQGMVDKAGDSPAGGDYGNKSRQEAGAGGGPASGFGSRRERNFNC